MNRISYFIILLLTGVCHWTAAASEGTSVFSQKGTINNVEKTGQIGVGVQVGNLTGVTGQYWTSNATALNGAISFDSDSTALSLSHVWMFRRAVSDRFSERAASYFVPFAGIGALAAFGSYPDYWHHHHGYYYDHDRRYSDRFSMAVRVPLGMEFLPSSERFGIFAELAPSLEVTPEADFFITADLGARFYF